jgi:hypothetical protein
MSLSVRKGQRFHCQNTACDCEIEITRPPKSTLDIANPRCVCGSEMKRLYVTPTIITRRPPPSSDDSTSGIC